MARGRTKAHYTTDGHTGQVAGYLYQVPDNIYAEADIGWSARVPGESTAPKNFKPRHVLGVDAAGYRHRLICPDPTAAIWIGTVTTWTGYANDDTTYTATVTGYVGEAFSL
jgi:hypothetical protein